MSSRTPSLPNSCGSETWSMVVPFCLDMVIVSVAIVATYGARFHMKIISHSKFMQIFDVVHKRTVDKYHNTIPYGGKYIDNLSFIILVCLVQQVAAL